MEEEYEEQDVNEWVENEEEEDGSIYAEDSIYDMVDNDEISAEEAGFMNGYNAG